MWLMGHKFRAQLRSGEVLAVKHDPQHPETIQADILDLLFAEQIVDNYEVDGACVVTIRGPLEHHKGPYGDNYESILERFRDAIASDKPCVILDIDSPGGVVSGLNETVYAMQEAARESGKDVTVFVNELCASAAYALSCAGSRTCAPESAILGSIGVISTQYDVTEANKMAGVTVVTITSGARKADGHADVRITDDAIAAERERVNILAKQFFRLVAEARNGLDAKPLEAALFMGKPAIRAGLSDCVMSWDQLLVDIAEDYGTAESSVAQNGTPDTTSPKAEPMNLNALISRATKALAAEKDPKKRKVIAAELRTFQAALSASTKKTYKKMEEEETEESTDDEEDDEEEGGNDTDRDEEDDSPDKDDDDSGDKKEESEDDKKEASSEEESEEESAETEKKGKKAKKAEKDTEEEAIAALAKRSGKLSALLAKAEAFDAMGSEVARLSAQDATTKKLAMIDKALKAHRISPAHAAMLRGKSTKFAKDFISMHKASLVFNEHEDETIPDDTGPGATKGQYPKWMQKQFEMQASAAGLPVEKVIENYTKEQAKASNGAGRY